MGEAEAVKAEKSRRKKEKKKKRAAEAAASNDGFDGDGDEKGKFLAPSVKDDDGNLDSSDRELVMDAGEESVKAEEKSRRKKEKRKKKAAEAAESNDGFDGDGDKKGTFLAPSVKDDDGNLDLSDKDLVIEAEEESLKAD